MKSPIRTRWLAVLGLVFAIGAYGTDGVAQTGAGRLAPQTVGDTLAELDRQPDATVRVIVTFKPGAGDQVAAAAKKAGASGVNPMFGKQSMVIEGTAAQVRAAVNTGQVTAIRRDAAAPAN